jgi:hypothetical protein
MMANIINEVAGIEKPITIKKVNKDKRERHLKWHERQWGSGALFGAQIGWMIGIVTTVPLMFLCKWLVNIWMGM